jgi:hypothetical protein
MTLGAWARREVVLVAVVGVGAACAGLAVPLGVGWLASVGAVVVSVGAVVRLVVAFGRTQMESERERVESARHLRVSVGPVEAVDPTLIGVDLASQSILPGGGIPVYVARDVDASLRRALVAGLEGSGPWLVVVHGAAKVGKSRSLFEALSAVARATPVDLVAPVDGTALKALLTPGMGVGRYGARAVLWLDDLEPFVNSGVTLQTLREWHAGTIGRIVAATYGGKGVDLVAASRTSELATLASEVLGHAAELPIRATTAEELNDPVCG